MPAGGPDASQPASHAGRTPRCTASGARTRPARGFAWPAGESVLSHQGARGGTEGRLGGGSAPSPREPYSRCPSGSVYHRSGCEGSRRAQTCPDRVATKQFRSLACVSCRLCVCVCVYLEARPCCCCVLFSTPGFCDVAFVWELDSVCDVAGDDPAQSRGPRAVAPGPPPHTIFWAVAASLPLSSTCLRTNARTAGLCCVCRHSLVTCSYYTQRG